MKVITLSTAKGGSGRSTTAVNLGAYLAIKGIKTLLIDMDPQGSATTHLGIDKDAISGKTMNEVLLGKISIKDPILPTMLPNLFILPANNELAEAEEALHHKKFKETILKSKMSEVTSDFQLCVIDTPPSLGILTLNAIIAADMVIVPIQTQYFALDGLKQITGLLDELGSAGYSPDRRYLLTFFNRSKKLSKNVVDDVTEILGDQVFESIIPDNTKLAEAPAEGKPIPLYAPDCIGAKRYEALADELLKIEGMV